MQVAMDSMVGNAYLYGRKWIAAKAGITDFHKEAYLNYIYMLHDKRIQFCNNVYRQKSI